MKEKKKNNSSCLKLDIPAVDLVKKPSSSSNGGLRCRKWIRFLCEFVKEDRNRVAFPLKVALSILLVSQLLLFQAPFEVFGTNTIWSIFTVIMMVEPTVGETFNRGFSRALGGLFGGLFAVGVIQVAATSGHVAEPYLIGLSIFLVGAVTSFMKLSDCLTGYECGFRVFLFTYNMIIVSGYRIGSPVRSAIDRMYPIGIGVFVTVLVNATILPVWAGEQLHIMLTNNFILLADSLEECVKKYLNNEESDSFEFSKTVFDGFSNQNVLQRSRAMLNSSTEIDSLVDSARWEPPHGRFSCFFYPWPEYVKLGAVLRHCASTVVALHGCLHSEIQAPYNLRAMFQSEILEAAGQAAELLRSLGNAMRDMKHGSHISVLKRMHGSMERLMCSIDMQSHLLTSNLDFYKFSTKQSEALLNTLDSEEASTVNIEGDSCHERRKREKSRLHSWPPPGEVDGFENGGVGVELILRLQAVQSTRALSLATFTSLLVELLVRLDHLVDTVDVLAKKANFK